MHHSATLGLVVVDRNTVPVGPADVNLSFGAHPAELAARVVFLHPLHNFAVGGYESENVYHMLTRCTGSAVQFQQPHEAVSLISLVLCNTFH